MLRIVALLVLSSLVVSTIHAGTCYPYEPKVVTLEGILVGETFPGSPNYESIKKGNKKESYFLLTFPEPICTVATEDDVMSDSEDSVTKMQLMISSNSRAIYNKLQSELGKTVKCTGTLYYHHTGHHHTPVLMTVKDCESVSSNGAQTGRPPSSSAILQQHHVFQE